MSRPSDDAEEKAREAFVIAEESALPEDLQKAAQLTNEATRLRLEEQNKE